MENEFAPRFGECLAEMDASFDDERMRLRAMDRFDALINELDDRMKHAKRHYVDEREREMIYNALKAVMTTLLNQNDGKQKGRIARNDLKRKRRTAISYFLQTLFEEKVIKETEHESGRSPHGRRHKRRH